MDALLLAQDPLKAATDLVSARDVVPFMGAVIALLLWALVYVFRLRERDRDAHFAHLTQLNNDLAKKKPGDTNV